MTLQQSLTNQKSNTKLIELLIRDVKFIVDKLGSAACVRWLASWL